MHLSDPHLDGHLGESLSPPAMALPLFPNGGSHQAWEVDVLFTVKDTKLGKGCRTLSWTQRSLPDSTPAPDHGDFWRADKVRLQRQQNVHFINSTNQNYFPNERRSIKTLILCPKDIRSLNPSSYSDTCFRVSIPFGQWRTKTITGSASPKTEVRLTQGNQVPIVLQHHISVHDLLCGVQELPLLPGEVHKHILEGHQYLQHETSLHWARLSLSLSWILTESFSREHWWRERRWTWIYLGVSTICVGFWSSPKRYLLSQNQFC